MKRRHFLGLTSFAGLSSCREVAAVSLWKGIAMGIEVSVQYSGDADLEPALKVVSQVEEALTLWSADSALSRLNQTGFLKNPPAALLACLLHLLFEDDNFLIQKLNYYPFYSIYDLIP